MKKENKSKSPKEIAEQAPLPVSLSHLECLFREGIPCRYARFHQPVPPYVNKEPVSEFKLSSTTVNDKYLVDAMSYTGQGLIFKAKDEVNIVPLANIIYVRS